MCHGSGLDFILSNVEHFDSSSAGCPHFAMDRGDRDGDLPQVSYVSVTAAWVMSLIVELYRSLNLAQRERVLTRLSVEDGEIHGLVSESDEISVSDFSYVASVNEGAYGQPEAVPTAPAQGTASNMPAVPAAGVCGLACQFCPWGAAGPCNYPAGHHLHPRAHRHSCLECTQIHHRRSEERRAARRGRRYK